MLFHSAITAAIVLAAQGALAGPACDRQAQIMEDCQQFKNNPVVYTDCLCNSKNLFQAAWGCAKEKGNTDIKYSEYWRLYYTELKYRFCQEDGKRIYNGDYDRAYHAHNNIWAGRDTLTFI